MVEVIKENNGIVIGNANREAWDICTNVINDSNRKHYIITISGESGGGKTYLLKSLKRNLSLECYKKNCRFLSGFDFKNENILNDMGLNTQSLDRLIENYSQYDVVFIDDVDEIYDSDLCLEHLVGLIDNYVTRNKLIIMSVNFNLTNALNIYEPFKIRMNRGLNIQLNPPDFEMRVEILRFHTDYLGVKLNEEELYALAKDEMNGFLLIGNLKKYLFGRSWGNLI